MEQRLIEPLFVPETMPVLRLLETFKQIRVHLAFVVDEYGDFLGVVTLNDVLEGIAGDLGDEHEQHSEDIIRRPDGSWLVDGRASVGELGEKLRLDGYRGRIPHRRRLCARPARPHSGRVRDLRNSGLADRSAGHGRQAHRQAAVHADAANRRWLSAARHNPIVRREIKPFRR